MQPADNYQADLDDYLDDIRPDAGTFYTTGTIDFATGGYAFLRRKTTTADIFIPQQATGGAVTGDSVRAFVVADDSGRYEGCVVEVITRNCKPITGIVVMDSDLVTLLPYKPIGYTVVLETGATHLQDGDMILAHIVAWPGKPGDVIRASVRAACSAPHLPENALPSICLEFGIPLAFPPGVDAESAVIPRDVTTDDLEDRYDYRALPFITIDGETSRDFDDAVYLEPQPDGGWLLCVAIADVSHYVAVNSLLDQEALLRGTSTYFPDQCIPMLPEALSNGICSLNEGVDRLVVVCEMDVNAGGEVLSHSFHNGVIRSIKRMTYDQVDRIMGGVWNTQAIEIVTMLAHMNECWRVLNKKRMERGALDFEPPASDSADGLDTGANRTDSHRLIEEFMLAANESAAQFICEATGESLLRVHEPPDPAKLKALMDLLAPLGISPPRGYQTPAAIIRSVIDQASNRPDRDIILSCALRAMKKAKYALGQGDDNSLHFSLQTSLYTHFTSPIRRYPDLVVHRHIKGILSGGSPDLAMVNEVAEQCSDRERASTNAERAMNKRLHARIMEQHIGETFNGFVSTINRRGIHVVFGEQFEGIITPSSLEAKGLDYCLEEGSAGVTNGHAAWVSYEPGTKVVIAVTAADEYRRSIMLELSLKPFPKE